MFTTHLASLNQPLLNRFKTHCFFETKAKQIVYEARSRYPLMQSSYLYSIPSTFIIQYYIH